MLTPSGELADVPLWGRLGSILIAFAAFFLFRRNVIAAVLTGEALLITAAYWVRMN